jgi:D-glycero-D-manno-heptose 1,7-bisphosphate phosphatase
MSGPLQKLTIAPLVVLDRDGTLIRHIPYLCDPSQVELLPTVIDGLRLLRDSGCKLFLHTNQSGIGRGFFDYKDAVACNEKMIEEIGLGGSLFDDICISPEAPSQVIVRRKPSPRFGFELIEKYKITCDSLIYMGDNITDLLTAENIGCVGVGVNTGMNDLTESLHKENRINIFPVFDRFVDAAYFIRSSRVEFFPSLL